MKLHKDEYEKYNELGYFFIQEAFNYSEISKVKNEIQSISYKNLPGTILDKELNLKSIHGIHLYSNAVDEISRHPKILKSVTYILKGKVYIHQSKLNRKSEFNGSSYPWHQDYTHWYYEDKIPKPEMINVAIFLDEVSELNSPILLVPSAYNIEPMKAMISKSTNTKIWMTPDNYYMCVAFHPRSN